MNDPDRQYVDRLETVISLGVDMRRLQRIYFRTVYGSKEKRAALDNARYAERLFDEALAKLKTPGLNL